MAKRVTLQPTSLVKNAPERSGNDKFRYRSVASPSKKAHAPWAESQEQWLHGTMVGRKHDKGAMSWSEIEYFNMNL